MRILWLTWKDITHPEAGGAEVMSSQLARRLVMRGHEVTFVTAAYAGAEPCAEIDGYRIVRLGNRYSVYWKAFRHVKQRLAAWPDLVVEEINTVPFFSRFALPDTPRVLLFYMLCRAIWFYQLPPPVGLVGYLLEPAYLRLLRRDPAIALSASTKADLCRHGFSPRQIYVMPAAIELTPFDDLRLVRKFDKPTVVALGSMRPMKRTLEQIAAYERARSVIPDLQLKIAGSADGAYGKKVLAAIEASPYRPDIDYMGRISEDDKRALLQRSHVIVVTSIKEGWGLIVTEAAGQGTPAVVYDVDGLRDSVRQNQTGIVTAPNPQALATGIATLLADPQLYARLQENGWRLSRQLTFDNAFATFSAVLESRVAS